MIAIDDCRFGHSSKKLRSFCVYHVDPFNQRLGLQGSSQRDHCGEQTKGSNDLDNLDTKKSPSFFKVFSVRRLTAGNQRPLKGLYDNHQTIPWDIPLNKKRGRYFLGLDPSTPIDQPSSRET